MRAGYTVFPISARNSPAAVAHLLKKANVTHLFVGQDGNVPSVIDAAYNMLEDSRPKTFPMPTYQDLFSDSDENSKPLPFERPSFSAVAMILHSSGSTAFPKPIPMTNLQMLQLSRTPCKLTTSTSSHLSLTVACRRVRRHGHRWCSVLDTPHTDVPHDGHNDARLGGQWLMCPLLPLTF